MAPSYPSVLALALALLPLLAADARAQLLLEVDGIELHGTARLVRSGAATCNVLETDTQFEERQANHGAPLDLWRLDFSVRNGSGRWLNHVRAQYGIDSQSPACTNWDRPEADQLLDSIFPRIRGIAIGWAGTFGFIQETGRNVVAPDQTLTDTELLLVLRGDRAPQFADWSVDFTLGVTPAGSAGAATCAGQAEGAACWNELTNSPGCRVWDDYYILGQPVTWTGGCSNRLASGSGTLNWSVLGDEETGTLRDGKRTGYWVEVDEFYRVSQGPYVDGARNGYWVIRDTDGAISQGPLVDGERNGRWFERYANVDSSDGSYVDGKRHGRWVYRYANGDSSDGSYVDGKRHGYSVHFTSEGVEDGSYVDGKRHGRWVTHYPDGTTETKTYIAGEIQ